MAEISESKRIAKSGLEMTFLTPRAGAGEEILALVRSVALGRELLSEPDEFPASVEVEEEWIESCHQDPNKIIIVAKAEGRIVGMMNFQAGHRKRIAHQGEFGMSVDPALQGQGIGKLMLEELIRWLKVDTRIETLRLSVFSKNSRAISLYRKLGFIEEGRQLKGVKYADDTYDDVVGMALSLR